MKKLKIYLRLCLKKKLYFKGKAYELCFFFFVIGLATISLTSCKKLVDIPAPSYAIDDKNVFTNDATAIAVITGIYTGMSNNSGPFTGNQSIALFAGLSSDELTLYNGVTNTRFIAYYQNALSAIVPPLAGHEFWTPLYNYVFKCNAAIEGLMSQEAKALLTPAVRQQLLGEAKFMRAFFYFYLVNLFGDVPLAVTTDPFVNAKLGRESRPTVYQLIIQDLIDAKELLSEIFLDGTLVKTTQERVRPSTWAASALLARVYLFSGDWANAENESSSTISNTSFFRLSQLNGAFLKASLGNKEAIWQLQPTALFFNTQEAITFIIPAAGPTNGLNATNAVYLSNYLLISFEANDKRAMNGNWVNTITVSGKTYRYPFKYKINAQDTTIKATTGSSNMKEFLMMLRLGEQFLIRAEARAQQNNINGAKEDLDSIRIRAGLPKTIANDKISLLNEILHERQVELFAEWGFRWLDLKRTGRVDDIMKTVTPAKANGAPWKSYYQWYPLPQRDLDRAPNLEQNEGYN
jgi:starch-binding outer membrane protein, SusD/RagB family